MKLSALAKKVRPHGEAVAVPSAFKVDVGHANAAALKWEDLRQIILSWKPEFWSVETPSWNFAGTSPCICATYHPTWGNFTKLEATLVLVPPKSGDDAWMVHMEWLVPSSRTGSRFWKSNLSKSDMAEIGGSHERIRMRAESMSAAFMQVAALHEAISKSFKLD